MVRTPIHFIQIDNGDSYYKENPILLSMTCLDPEREKQEEEYACKVRGHLNVYVFPEKKSRLLRASERSERASSYVYTLKT